MIIWIYSQKNIKNVAFFSSLSSISEDLITFGKYKGLYLQKVLRDRKYCSWLLQQDWFKNQYSYLYKKVLEYNPKNYFYNTTRSSFFDLVSPEKISLPLSDVEKKCYEFYFNIVQKLKDQAPALIKVPKSWLQIFEKTYSISRDILKEFLDSHELPNIAKIVEDVKREAGLKYNGRKSFLIAKEKSLDQEKFWEELLKNYINDLGVQYKYKNCFFDFIDIKNNIVYECKLGLKDFSREQYDKYVKALEKFKIVYLIGKDCIIDINEKTIFSPHSDYPTICKGVFGDIIKSFSFQEMSFENYFELVA